MMVHCITLYYRGATSNWVSGATVLPIEMTYFKGQAIAEGSLLEWQTATEEKNQGFEIQRSQDGKHWENIGFKTGAGTTLEVQNYQFIDGQSLSGVNYYRLKQLDYDGSFEFSHIVTINYKLETTNDNVQIFPNPVQNQLNISNGKGIATIYNLLGQPVRELIINNEQYSINTRDLSKGQYILSIQKGNGKVITDAICEIT